MGGTPFIRVHGTPRHGGEREGWVWQSAVGGTPFTRIRCGTLRWRTGNIRTVGGPALGLSDTIRIRGRVRAKGRDVRPLG